MVLLGAEESRASLLLNQDAVKSAFQGDEALLRGEGESLSCSHVRSPWQGAALGHICCLGIGRSQMPFFDMLT